MSGISDFFKNLNPKQIARNVNVVRSSPYANLKFQYQVTRGLVVLMILFIAYQLISLVIYYKGGSGVMSMVGRIAIVLIMFMVISRIWGTLTPLKKALEHYEKNPQTKGKFQQIDINTEVDSILSNFDNNGKRIKK